MIKIEAIVRPDRINIVIDALDAAGCRGFNVQNVNGRGQQQGVEVFTGRGATTATRTSLPKAMITTVVQDADKEKIIDVILGSAKSSEEGAIGDGKFSFLLSRKSYGLGLASETNQLCRSETLI